jgi:tRNA-dihydrouridine synthase B
VQIVGYDAQMMADAARACVDHGAQIVDINMGCPAKKVCNRDAGSALLRDERLVAAILDATVSAVDAPVTLKIRTGWAPDQRNAVRIARLAESCGIRALAVHGRTRACRFNGAAEYSTIAAVKSAVQIPVFANGDIDTPAKAVQVLRDTGADGVMIGRAAQGRPWIFREINALFAGAQAMRRCFAKPSCTQLRQKRRRRWCVSISSGSRHRRPLRLLDSRRRGDESGGD